MSSIPDDGGPAFPVSCSADGVPLGVSYQNTDGMTLRDWFAGVALQGILAANAKCSEEVNDKNVDFVVAREAYASADAMIEARKKKTP